MTEIADLADKVKAVYASRQPVAECPMLDFDERDLFDPAEGADFEEIHLRYEANLVSGYLGDGTRAWETALRSTSNPLAPTLGGDPDPGRRETLSRAPAPSGRERRTKEP